MIALQIKYYIQFKQVDQAIYIPIKFIKLVNQLMLFLICANPNTKQALCNFKNINMNQLHNQTKNGVFLCKDQKISTLENNNEKLKQQLAKQLELFHLLNKQNQQVDSKCTNLTMKKSLIQMEQTLLQQNISKLQNKILQYQPFINQFHLQISLLTQQVNLLQDQLQAKVSKVSQDDNLVKRYKQEVRNEKLMIKSQKNLNKISQTFKKSFQNYQKNVQILQNKLESKNKYLNILVKKVEKEKEANKEKQKAKPNIPQSNFSSSRLKLSQKKISHNGIKNEEQQKQTKSQIKSYNDLVRKKNAILCQRK